MKNKYHILTKCSYFASIITAIALFSGCAARGSTPHLWQAKGRIIITTAQDTYKVKFTWKELPGQNYIITIKDLFARNIASGSGNLTQLKMQLQQQTTLEIPLNKIAKLLQYMRSENVRTPHLATITQPKVILKIAVLSHQAFNIRSQ